MNDVKKIKTVCNMCQTACSGIIAHVKDGAVLKLEGDPECPPSYGKFCVKGLAGTLSPSNPNRILKPMRRTNSEKGLGVDPKWKEITWEEAFDEIVPRMKRIRQENSLKLMLSSFDYPQYYHMIPWCIAFGAQYYVGAATLCGIYHNSSYHYYLSFFRDPDFEYTNYLVLWGTQSGHLVDALPVSSAKKLADARVRGAKIIVIDPVATPAASLADEWVPIRPGTDGLLALCFANLLLNEYGLYDHMFMQSRTNGPYLVRADESYLRDGATNKPMVWDETNRAAVPFDSIPWEHMAMEGTFEVDGVVCQPSFQLLKNHLKQYTPEETSTVTTIPADDIRRIAREFGEAARIGSTITIQGENLPYRPAAVLTGRGPNANRHGMHTAFATDMLNVLVGNLNVPGGILGIGANYKHRWGPSVDEDGIALSPNSTYWHFFGALDSYPARPAAKPFMHNLNSLFPVAAFTDNLFPLAMTDPKRFGIDYDLEFLIISHVNPLSTYINPTEMIEQFKKIDFILGFGSNWNESLEMCDLVLPDATWLERYDPIANPPFKFVQTGMGDWHWAFRRPVVDPPSPDIRHWMEILLEITERVGFAKEYYEAFNEHNLIRDPHRLDPEKKNTFMDMCDAVMKDRYGVGVDWYEKNQTNVYIQEKSVDEAYPGPFVKGRYQVYMEYWKHAGEDVGQVVKELGLEDVWDLDDYRPLLNWQPSASLKKSVEHDLFAVNYKSCMHTFSHTMFNPLTLEIGHVYPWVYGVVVHTDTAGAKGIRDGDEIWVESEFGYRVKGRAVVTEGIHPECIGTTGTGGRLTFGEAVGRRVGPHWNTLVGQALDRIDKMSSSLDCCLRVKIYKV